MTDFLVKVAL